MSEQHDGGGPAFVIPAGGAFDNGMTLLDYFAGQAMASATDLSDWRLTAKDCYGLAAAMIAEKRLREGGGK